MLTTKTLTQDDLAEAVTMFLRSKRLVATGEIKFTCDPNASETFTASAQVDEIPRKKRAAK